MIEIINKEQCCGCHGCYNICPTDAISMVIDERGFKYPKVNIDKCIGCNLCEKVCPIINKKEEVINSPKSFACYNKDDEVRKNSSSGGVFSLLADFILKNDGVVYGASFNNEWIVEHTRIDNKDDLYKLRTSKYVQSNINSTYKDAKRDLDNNKMVLFTGTPCQVEGFISFLQGKQYDNLYTQDIICHGVPSPKVWKKYLDYRSKHDNDTPTKINFRKKDEGWSSYKLELKYKDKCYKVERHHDLYMQSFLRNSSLRDSCYNCMFKSKNRQTDITLADFWGIQNVSPEFNDDKGTSLVIINTNKGNELFKNIQNNLVFKETNFENSIKYNPAMFSSSKRPKGIDDFFANIDNMEFDELVKRYTIKPGKSNILLRILNKVKKLF